MTTDEIHARLAAAGLRVKPLVWQQQEAGERDEHWVAGSDLGTFYVFEFEGRGAFGATQGGDHISMSIPTLAAAIAACESHHEAQVLAMLVPVESETKGGCGE